MAETNDLWIRNITTNFPVLVSEPFMKALDRETCSPKLGSNRFGCKAFVEK